MNRILAIVPVLLLTAGSALAADGRPAGKLVGPQNRAFLLKSSEVRADVSGGSARVFVRQRFENPFRRPVEVVYRFPLPHSGAIDHARIEVGSRVIAAEISPTGAAVEKFRKAREEGKTASLTRQDRPNLFTQTITNLLPGEPITVELGFYVELDYVDGRRVLRLPVTTGPRYGSRRTSPRGRPGHELDLLVALDAGVPISDLRSESHAIQVVPRGRTGADVTLAPYDRLPVKDFVLSWEVAGPEPAVTLTTHRADWDGYFALVVLPDRQPQVRVGREVVFVVDTSGSMRNNKLMTAKRAVARAMTTLEPMDTFRVVRFAQRAEAFSRTAVPAVPANIREALGWIEGLASDGGTEIVRGVRMAFAGSKDRHRMRIVHFVSDGLVDNERQVLSKLRAVVGNSRVFPLGIGSSPNRFLLERMADIGRGSVDYLLANADDDSIDEAVERFVRRSRTPALTDITIDWGGLPVSETVPQRLPDLFSGKPLVVRGRYSDAASGEIVIRGYRGGNLWEKRIPVALPDVETANAALAPLWARARVRELMLGMYSGELGDVREEVTALGLRHGLLTKWTSFFAVEETVVNPGKPPEVIREPLPMPEGYGGESYHSVLLDRRVKRKARAPTAVATPQRPLKSRATFSPIDSVLDLHLSYLGSWQNSIGSFDGRGDLVGDVGATSIALLAYRASNRTDRDRKVKAALRWLRGTRRSDGTFGGRDRSRWQLDHALAVIALIEHGAASKKTRSWLAVRKAVEVLVEEAKRGYPDRLTASVAAIALAKAKAAGCEVPRRAIYAVQALLDTDRDQRTNTEIAASILARFALGQGDSHRSLLEEDGATLIGTPAPVGDRKDPLFLFLGTAAAKRLGGRFWRNWSAPLNEACRKAMLPTKKGERIGPVGSRVGRETAMALFGLARQCYKNPKAAFVLR
jgi:Ca-activated chloride channel family protein